MKTLILYQTKYGSTKQYAQWLHEEVPQSTLSSLKELRNIDLSYFDQIVLGSCTYMGRISATSFLVSQWLGLSSKKVFLFAVGSMPPESAESKQSYQILPETIRTGLCGYFKFPGRIDFNQMNFLDKLIIRKMGGNNEDKTDRSLLKILIQQLI